MVKKSYAMLRELVPAAQEVGSCNLKHTCLAVSKIQLSDIEFSGKVEGIPCCDTLMYQSFFCILDKCRDKIG